MEDPFRRPTFGPALFYKEPFAALDWLENAFGFERTMVITDADGVLGHAEMRFGDGYIMIGSEWVDYVASPKSLGGKNTQTLHVHLPDGLDAHCARARAAGAEILRGAGGAVLWRPHLYGARSRGLCLVLCADHAQGFARGGGAGERAENRRMGVGAPEVDRVLAALADPHRRRVVELLRAQPMRAGELAAAVGLAPPAMSRHLRTLRSCGLIEDRHPAFDARVRVYSLRPEPMAQLRRWLEETERLWADQLTRLQGPSGANRMTSRVLVALRVAATPERAFAVFTAEIGTWWHHDGLFAFTDGPPGRLAFEPGPGRAADRDQGGWQRVRDRPDHGVGARGAAGIHLAPGLVRAGPGDPCRGPFRTGGRRDPGHGRALRLGHDPAGPCCPAPLPACRPSSSAAPSAGSGC